jgi:NAD(P)-dependent dehydrogenase (short-subunit alcohol dehydrogenase family)
VPPLPTVLITGAGRGIGRTTAERLAAAGFDVYSGVRDPQDAPAGTTPVTLDITDADHVGALDGALPERLDGLVNNAGVVVAGPVEGVPLDDLRRQLEVNVTAQVAVTQALLGRLRASQGRIVFLSSVSGRVATPFQGPYNASKFAIEAIADALRIELRPWMIGVSLVEPGAIDTDLWRRALEQADEVEATMDPRVLDLYAPQVKGLRKSIARIQKQTSPPERVAAAIQRALTDGKPKARYVVGLDARAQIALKAALPTRALDAALGRLVTGGK